MLNRSTGATHGNDPHPWGIVSPRRAQTTIHTGHSITDNRSETRVHHDNSKTINDSSNSAVFNAPVQGYVHTAKNRGAVNGYVQITNVFHKAGGSGEASPRGGLNENPSPITTVPNRVDQTIYHRGGSEESNKAVGYSTTVAVGEAGSSTATAPDHLEQELHGLSPTMQAFVRSLQERQSEYPNAEPVKRRNRTI